MWLTRKVSQEVNPNTMKTKSDKRNRLSLFVDFPYELSNKFIEDFERIIEFIERRHIAL